MMHRTLVGKGEKKSPYIGSQHWGLFTVIISREAFRLASASRARSSLLRQKSLKPGSLQVSAHLPALTAHLMLE